MSHSHWQLTMFTLWPFHLWFLDNWNPGKWGQWSNQGRALYILRSCTESLWYSNLYFLRFILCVQVLCLHVCLWTIHMQCLWSPEEAVRPPGTRAVIPWNMCLWACFVGTGNQTWVLWKKRQGFLTAEPSLGPSFPVSDKLLSRCDLVCLLSYHPCV